MGHAVGYESEILRKPGMGEFCYDALSRIQISTLFSLSDNIKRTVVNRYKKELFRGLIKEMEKKRGKYTRLHGRRQIIIFPNR